MTDPSISKPRAEMLERVLPRFFGPLDGSARERIEGQLAWRALEGGEVLFRQGDEADGMYLLLSGRLVALVESDGNERLLGDVAPGESVGEMALITGDRRTATVRALRDSVLVHLDPASFQALVDEFPGVGLALCRVVVDRLRARTSSQRETEEVTNVVVLAAGDSPSSQWLARELAERLERFGAVARLDHGAATDALGGGEALSAAAGSEGHARLTAWLDQVESKHRYVVYETDPGPTPWSRRCLRQADVVLAVGESGCSPKPNPLEGLIAATPAAAAASHFLTLVHGPGTERPSPAAPWLETRDPMHVLHVRRENEDDLARLARLVAGRAVGLVLGGGGARGLAHVGIHRALREAGVPIDLVGGSSIGAAIAAGVARGFDTEELGKVARYAFVDSKPLGDYTLPMISLVRGNRLEEVLAEHLDVAIEDLWHPFFCTSSNMSDATLRIHRRGSLWRAVRASVALPGVFPPAVDGNSLLIDGGILNNLPVDVMRNLSAGLVVAVDLHVEKEYELQYTRMPSPWQLLRSRYLPFTRRLRAPGITTIMLKATEISSIVRAREVHADADLVLNPPVGRFGILDFDAYDRISQVGYDYAREPVATWWAQAGAAPP